MEGRDRSVYAETEADTEIRELSKFHGQYLHLYLKAMVECAVAWWNDDKIKPNQ